MTGEFVREEAGTSAQPEWLELPDKESYWSCTGQFQKLPWWKRNHAKSAGWVCVYYTQEDAEADASNPNPLGWKWDREPATTCTIAETMREARRDGCPGVIVQSYVDGKFRTVKRYPAGVPLPMPERE